MLDAKSNANTLGFSYDGVNRLGSFSNGSGSMQQSFASTAYGNQTATVNGNATIAFNPVNNRINNLPCASSLPAFDNAGNQLCDTDPYGANRVYAFKANGLVSGVMMQNGNSQLVSYDYLPDNSRVRKSLATGAWTEYIYFGGQAIAEKDQTGAWTDYIYANGQKIARAPQMDNHIHISANAGNGGFYQWYDLQKAHGYAVRQGDRLNWRQYQGPSARGGMLILTSEGGDTAWNPATNDQNNNTSNQDGVTGVWEARAVDLSSLANQHISLLAVGLDGGTTGNVTIDYGEISLTSTDGTVQTIFAGSPVGVSPWSGNYGMANAQLSFASQSVTAVPSPSTTLYYHGDQIGSARLTTSGAGWPTTSDTFYPFGQEPGGTAGTTHFQYAGLERDPETGLDHATFRQYSANTGRWMSPDPYDGSMDLSNPQSLNRYSYALNNPLRFRDPNGLTACQNVTINVTINSDGSQSVGDAAASELFSCGFWSDVAIDV